MSNRSWADRVRVATSALVLTVTTGFAIPAGTELAQGSRPAVSVVAQSFRPVSIVARSFRPGVSIVAADLRPGVSTVAEDLRPGVSTAGEGLHPAVSTVAQGSGAAVTQVRVGILRGGSYDVTTMPLEAYVARVLAGEMARDSPPAALEALAIAIRTYALANRGRHRTEGFDLCDQTHCQVVRAATATTERVAQATAGQVLMYNGLPASIYYSASCGGRTERPSAVWTGAEDPPYLPSRPDDACGGE